MRIEGAGVECLRALAIPVYDIADCQTDLSFPTEARTYRLDVAQPFPAPRSEAFTLRLTIR